jgi:hypothetical protein
MNENEEYISECKALIDTVQGFLHENLDEWGNRYEKYAEQILKNKDKILNKKSNFNEWDPLFLYMTIGSAKQGMQFSLRYQGQDLARLKVGINEDVTISTKTFDKKNESHFGCKVCLENAPWRSGKASVFRKHFVARPIRLVTAPKGNEEHRVESLLLTEFSKQKSENKILCNIQPVKIGGIARFQMPTPLKASDLNTLSYSGSNGGGIDILCRIGTGGSVKLCVMEVKDEHSSAEPPIKAVKQGLAYAVFLRELLRSSSGKMWWEIFGFTSKKLPKKLEICVVSAMPPKIGEDLSFAGKVITIPESEDCIHLHYLSFEERDNLLRSMTTSLTQCVISDKAVA